MHVRNEIECLCKPQLHCHCSIAADYHVTTQEAEAEAGYALLRNVCGGVTYVRVRVRTRTCAAQTTVNLSVICGKASRKLVDSWSVKER